MRAVFAMALISAFLSLATAVGLSAMSIVPRPGAERLRMMEMAVATCFFFGWLVLALWARARQRVESSAPVPAWLRGALLVVSALYSLGIVIGVLG